MLHGVCCALCVCHVSRPSTKMAACQPMHNASRAWLRACMHMPYRHMLWHIVLRGMASPEALGLGTSSLVCGVCTVTGQQQWGCLAAGTAAGTWGRVSAGSTASALPNPMCQLLSQLPLLPWCKDI